MNNKNNIPTNEELETLLEYYNKGNTNEAEQLAISINEKFPENQFAWKVLGALWWKKNKISEALKALETAIELSPKDPSAHYNLGVAFQEIGKLDEAEKVYRKVIKLKKDYPEVYNNLGVVLQAKGMIEEAKESFKLETIYNPGYSGAFWNLSSCVKTIKDSEYWIDKCLAVDPNHINAKLTKAALSYYSGNQENFYNLMESAFKSHSFMRSFSWVFNLPYLPELHFNTWYFFDSVIKKSITTRPFYEYGVWRASSFKYLIKKFKKGYGFDTFTGLPENWNVGEVIEKKGTYSNDGNIPKIKGGEFIIGEFKDTLPIFFSRNRPIASMINFDADLYSSTICALNYSKEIIDENTILVFDQFLINESWEEDEFKALNEFCSNNKLDYKVLAVSFFTKQVAVKLVGF